MSTERPGRCPSGLASTPRAPAIDDACKLDPRRWRGNPVMFVVGSAAVSARSSTRPRRRARRSWFSGLVDRVLALVHRALRQLRRGGGRGPGSKAGRVLRKAPHHGSPPVRLGDRRPSRQPRRRSEVASPLRPAATSSWSRQVIPGDGDVMEGIASVDESAITGESAPVIRESGGDRSAVTGGTKVLSDRIVVQITRPPGELSVDRMIALVEGRQPAEDAERDRAEHPARRALTIIFLLRGDTAAVLGAGTPGGARRLTVDGSSHRAVAAGLSDPDDHRRAALGHRHRRHGPAGAAQRAGHVRPRSRRPAT